MKELKSKKTGRISVLNEQEYAEIVNKKAIDLKLFTVTNLQMRPIVPSLKREVPKEEAPIELKKIIKKPKE